MAKEDSRENTVSRRLYSNDIKKIDGWFNPKTYKNIAERHHNLVLEYERALPYLKSSEPDSLKEIINSYPNCRCTSCNRYLKTGEKFLWGRNQKGNPIRVCIDCQINSETDKAIVRKLIKKKRLDREIEALEAKRESLIVEVEEKSIKEEIEELAEQVKNLWIKIDNGAVWYGVLDNFIEALERKYGEGFVNDDRWDRLANKSVNELAESMGVSDIHETVEEIHIKVKEISAFFESKMYRKAIKTKVS